MKYNASLPAGPSLRVIYRKLFFLSLAIIDTVYVTHIIGNITVTFMKTVYTTNFVARKVLYIKL